MARPVSVEEDVCWWVEYNTRYLLQKRVAGYLIEEIEIDSDDGSDDMVELLFDAVREVYVGD